MPLQILCPQCSAPLEVEAGSEFVTCPFCSATNYVDKSQVVLHYAVQATLEEAGAEAALRRWMGGNATVKNLDTKARIERPSFQLFPLWMLTVQKENAEKVVIEPAAALPITELLEIRIPASDLQPYDHTLESAAIEPTVPYETVKKWLTEQHKVGEGDIKSSAIVHVPIFVCKYWFEDRAYTALIDAASSEVFASIFPSKWETPYRALGCVTFILYFLLSAGVAGGYMAGGGEGAFVGLAVYFIVGAILAIPIFMAAAYISAKV